MERDFSSEFKITTARSSGNGGQNVNKVSSKVILRFNIPNSALLTTDEKQLLITNLDSRLTTEGDWIIVSQNSRSQLTNKEKCFEKFYKLLEIALIKPVPRKKVVMPKAMKIKRRENKQLRSEVKESRKLPKNWDSDH